MRCRVQTDERLLPRAQSPRHRTTGEPAAMSALGILLVSYLAVSILMGTALVLALLYPATGVPAFNSWVYAALTDQIDRLNDGSVHRGQVSSRFFRSVLILSRGFGRDDRIWAQGIRKNTTQIARGTGREIGYRSLEVITANEDEPRTQRLRNALERNPTVAKNAEERGEKYATDCVKRIHLATSYTELRWLQWYVRWVRLRLLTSAMTADDMKARWIPFGSRFLDYLGRGGTCGLIVASAIGGSRADLNAWAAWISNVSIVGGAVGSICFCVVSIRDISATTILPDHAFNRFVKRFPWLAAALFPAFVTLWIAIIKLFAT
jgi:hypothetical protein